MTIAISMKLNDGIVLASDSASSVFTGTNVLNVYDNANKIFNLVKNKRIGCITWGLGNIGNASIETIIKDYREKLLKDIEKKDTLAEIANDFSIYIYDLYNKVFNITPIPEINRPILGFMIVGYSKDAPHAEEFTIQIIRGKLEGPVLIRQQEQTGMTWNGEAEPLTRLCLGYSNFLQPMLQQAFGITKEQWSNFMLTAQNNLAIPFVIPSMPIQDAIHLAEFLVDFVVKFSKFRPGPNTVGGAIEIAVITKHEGFKWVKRKHYYEEKYNPTCKEEKENEQ